MKSPYYCYQSRPSMAGLRFRFVEGSKFYDIARSMDQETPFPEGYECHEPVFIGSPKPKFYDMASDAIVSERLAEVLDREAGNKIQLIPIHYTPDQQTKFPATSKYFFLWVPKIDCLEYVYGDPLPVSESFRKRELKEGRTTPEMERPLLQLNLKMDVVAQYPMFRPADTIYSRSFMTEKIMKACKAEKFYGLHFSPYKEDLEHIRGHSNYPKGLDYLLYNLSHFYGIPGPPPAGITREFLTSLLPPK